MLNQTNQAMDIVADILADEQENTISSYQYNGVELTPVEPVTMRNTISAHHLQSSLISYTAGR